MDRDKDHKFCSFCMTPGVEVTHLSGGHGAWICQDCVVRFRDVFNSQEPHETALLPASRSMSDEEALQVLPQIVASGAQHDGFLHEWVDMLREQGISWHQIGLALGVSRQAAWQRFTRPRAAAPVTPARPHASS